MQRHRRQTAITWAPLRGPVQGRLSQDGSRGDPAALEALCPTAPLGAQTEKSPHSVSTGGRGKKWQQRVRMSVCVCVYFMCMQLLQLLNVCPCAYLFHRGYK